MRVADGEDLPPVGQNERVVFDPPRAGGAGRGFRPRLFSDVSYATQAVTHRIENIGTTLYRAIGVINETQGGDVTIVAVEILEDPLAVE